MTEQKKISELTNEEILKVLLRSFVTGTACMARIFVADKCPQKCFDILLKFTDNFKELTENLAAHYKPAKQTH